VHVCVIDCRGGWYCCIRVGVGVGVWSSVIVVVDVVLKEEEIHVVLFDHGGSVECGGRSRSRL
jgi:hypothetical protein